MVAQAPTSMADLELARALGGFVSLEMVGHERAVLEAELCRRFGPRVRLYGLRHLKQEAAAADLVQEVLMITLRKLRDGEMREPGKLGSFVLGTARTVARDNRRRALRDDGDTEAYDDLEHPDQPGLARLDGEQLKTCVSMLGERERAVILLTFFEDQSAGQIGAALAMQPGHVRVTRARALTRLRTCMGMLEDVP